jgi:aminoglycoside phosphotransferase (APT) family kinase protein
MTLTDAQLQVIVEHALPGTRLREASALADDRYRLMLVGGERLHVQTFASGDAALTMATALRQLLAEVDLPIPQLRASDPNGTVVGQPYVLCGELAGEPLEQALPRIGEEQLYALGRRIGEVLYRVHRLVCAGYGALAGGGNPTADNERDYVLARLSQELAACDEHDLLDQPTREELHDWFTSEFKPVSRQAALICAGLTPRTLLVRQREGRWWLSGVLGWEHALGWSPAWDHVTFLDAADDPQFFSLRVGYGNGYDEHTGRAYEQVREHALTPYRLLLALRRLHRAHADGAIAECERRRAVLHALMRSLEHAEQ